MCFTCYRTSRLIKFYYMFGQCFMYYNYFRNGLYENTLLIENIGSTVKNMKYVDDIVIISVSIKNLQQLLN